jgi:hypothetical protein
MNAGFMPTEQKEEDYVMPPHHVVLFRVLTLHMQLNCPELSFFLSTFFMFAGISRSWGYFQFGRLERGSRSVGWYLFLHIRRQPEG